MQSVLSRDIRWKVTGKPYSLISGAALMIKARSNMEDVLAFIVDDIRIPRNAREFVEEVIRLMHKGIPHHGMPHALRTFEAPVEASCPPADVREKWSSFLAELDQRLASDDDTVGIAAWAEYEIRCAIHPYADGNYRLACAVASWITLQRRHFIPNHHVGGAVFEVALSSGWVAFEAFYRVHCFVGDISEHPP